MQKLYLSLRQHLARLELQHCQTAEAITEIQRRIRILEEAMSWTAPEVKADQEVSEVSQELETEIAEPKLVSAGV